MLGYFPKFTEAPLAHRVLSCLHGADQRSPVVPASTPPSNSPAGIFLFMEKFASGAVQQISRPFFQRVNIAEKSRHLLSFSLSKIYFFSSLLSNASNLIECYPTGFTAEASVLKTEQPFVLSFLHLIRPHLVISYLCLLFTYFESHLMLSFLIFW